MAVLSPTPAALDSAFLSAALGAEHPQQEPVALNGVCTDTRALREGCCFLALQGERFDGNDYAADAVRKGARFCVLSRPPEEPLGVPFVTVQDTTQAYGTLARAWLRRLRESSGLKVCAVTGSSGKTTVKNMIARVLSGRFDLFATQGNHNNAVGLPETVLQCPENAQILVLEMGMNHRGEISALSKIAEPEYAVVTNIGMAHIGNLGSQTEIFRAKMEITDGMDLRRGRLFLPYDDLFLREYRNIPFIPANLRYSSVSGDTEAPLRAGNILRGPESTRFTVRYEGQEREITLKMTGTHNVSNALLAISVGLECGLTLGECAEALSDFTPSEMRSDRVRFGGLTIIRDYYNANPEATEAALTALRAAAPNARKVAVFGNMNELGDFAAYQHRRLGRLCGEYTDAAFFCGENYRDFAEGYGAAHTAFATKEEMLPKLLQKLPEYLDGETYLLIKGSRGMKLETVYDAISQKLASIL